MTLSNARTCLCIHQHDLALSVLPLRRSSGGDEAASGTVSPKEGWQGHRCAFISHHHVQQGLQRIFAACLRNESVTAKEFANGSKKGFGETR